MLSSTVMSLIVGPAPSTTRLITVPPATLSIEGVTDSSSMPASKVTLPAEIPHTESRRKTGRKPPTLGGSEHVSCDCRPCDSSVLRAQGVDPTHTVNSLLPK